MCMTFAALRYNSARLRFVLFTKLGGAEYISKLSFLGKNSKAKASHYAEQVYFCHQPIRQVMSGMKKIVVKVGTNVLTQPDGLIDAQAIELLVEQIAAAKNKGFAVILVSSGAVGAGRSILKVTEELSKVERRQVFAAVGQVYLMELYRKYFAQHGLFCAQVLATKEDFRDRAHYLNMRNCFQALLRDNIVPVVNENDVVSVTELMFTDNDELAALVAAMIGADTLLILSSVDGVLDGPPSNPGSKVISEVRPGDQQALSFVSDARSSFGRGGMQTKFRMAQRAAQVGINTYIANGKHPGAILDILEGRPLGTHFVALNRPSRRKTWLAYQSTGDKAVVYINEGAISALKTTGKATSLLPVGIIRIEGEFQRGDLLRIAGADGKSIGLGIAQYGSATARQHIGNQGKKPLVHYDYLYVE